MAKRQESEMRGYRLPKSAPVWAALAAALLLIAAGAGSYVVVSAGGGAGATPTREPSTATATATAVETAGTPAASGTATSLPPTSQPSAEPTSTSGPIHPGITCGDGEPRYHLNIEKLQAHPNLTGAEITEVDLDTIRIDIEGIEIFVTGWGEAGLAIAGYDPIPDDLFAQVALALDAVQYEC
jgi:hypothetical protein